jgi:glutathione synthase/RimK-type ligase-like ATP-grasp enzyme
VPAQVDLRITMMGEHVFAAAIYSQETSYTVDFRMDMDAGRVEAFEMPGGVIERLRALMERLGLVYGAIDMRLTPDGRYVFLEINPAGQWMFIEHRTGQPMTEAFVRLLMERDEERGSRRTRS